MRGMTAGSPPESFDRLVSLAEESRAALKHYRNASFLEAAERLAIGPARCGLLLRGKAPEGFL
jgi:hypothetical protein